MSYGQDGQFVNGEADVSSVYVPNTSPINSTILFDIEWSANLDTVFPSIFKTTPDIEAIYFASPRNLVRYYPNVNLGAVLPPDFLASTRPWYTGSLPENNPSGASWWTAPYLDATGLGLVTTSAAPVYSTRGELLGVVGLDITLNNLAAAVEASRFLNSGYSFLIDNQGRSIALPDQGFLDILGRAAGEADVNVDLLAGPSVFTPIIQEMIAGKSSFTRLEAGGRSLFVAYAPLSSTGWSLGSVVEAADVLGVVASLETDLTAASRRIVLFRILPISAAIFILVTLLGFILGNRLVIPLRNLSEAVRKLGAGEYELTLPATNNDEIGVLAAGFQRLAGQIRDLVLTLKSRVTQRTYDLERRTIQLQVASEIARGIRCNSRSRSPVGTYRQPDP